jgi:hypothetical protein
LDRITDVNYVRNNLAVTKEFKGVVSRAQTYEVIKPLPVRKGPVGPQIDRVTGQYRPGDATATQIEILVDKGDILNYIRKVGKARRIK